MDYEQGILIFQAFQQKVTFKKKGRFNPPPPPPTAFSRAERRGLLGFEGCSQFRSMLGQNEPRPIPFPRPQQVGFLFLFLFLRAQNYNT